MSFGPFYLILTLIILGSDQVLPAIEEKPDLINMIIEGMDVQNWDAESRKNWDDQRLKHAVLFLTIIQKSPICCQLVRKSVDVRRLIEGLVLTKEIQVNTVLKIRF